jgi:alpha-N-arabinofuranosidase
MLNGEVHFIDASAILEGTELKVFVTNRSLDEKAPLEIHLADRAISSLRDAELLTGPDPKAANSFEQPDRIRSQEFKEVAVKGGRAKVELPPLSVAAMTLELGG